MDAILEGWEGRLEKVISLKDQAESSAIPIPIPAFLKTHMNAVIAYISDDSKLLLEAFQNADDAWLDMRMFPESPSPREVAVALLLLTDFKDLNIEKPDEDVKDEKPN